MRKVSLIFLVSIFLFICCSDDSDPNGPEYGLTPEQMANLVVPNLADNLDAMVDGMSYDTGFEPDGPSTKKKKTKDDAPTVDTAQYDPITGWWWYIKDTVYGDSMEFVFAESLQYRDAAGDFQKAPEGADKFALRVYYDSRYFDYSFKADFDAIQSDTVAIEGLGEWTIESNSSYTFSISYVDISWIKDNDYPLDGAMVLSFDGNWMITIEFDGTAMVQMIIEGPEETQYYTVNLETGEYSTG